MMISVIGAGNGCSQHAYALAEAVGAEIGRRGHTVICGGLNGVMEAVCKGAKSAGGRTIGILPGEDRNAANPYVDTPVVTGLGYARNILVALTGQVAIAVDGEYGTLSEIAHALGYNKPVIGLKTWLLTRPDGQLERKLIVAEDPVDAVEKAIAAASQT